MSYEIKTRVKPDLPRGNYTVVARLTDFGGAAYTGVHADFLGDVLGVSASAIEAAEGDLYVALPTHNSEADGVIRQSARPLQLGLARLAMDPEIVAFAIDSSQLSPERPLSASFAYLSEDVSLELRDELNELALQPTPDHDLYLEIEHLSDF